MLSHAVVREPNSGPEDVMTRLSVLLAVLFTVACSSQSPPDPAPTDRRAQGAAGAGPVDLMVEAEIERPKRIIFFIGDGMGIPYVTAGAYAKGGPLAMMSMPYFTYLNTHEHEFAVTDSAASATAMATGFKTHFEAVSVKPGTTQEDEENPDAHLKTILEVARDAGLKTGLIATSRITHATPAAFGSHRAHRRSYESIALDLRNSGVDLLMGAGTKFFEARKDQRNLLEEMQGEGYTIARDPEELTAASEASRVVGLFHETDMPSALEGTRAMSLGDMVENAVEILDRGEPEGWFLMVEGSMIDWCGHDLDASCSLGEMLDFDDAVGRGLQYGRDRDDTLVVVTADHDVGALTVLDPRYAERFTTVLGGEKKITESLELPVGAKGPSPAPIEHFRLGAGVAPAEPSRVTGQSWDMTELEDVRMSITWGHFSLASRPLHTSQTDTFYSAHTLAMVPLFAEGPGADFVASVTDNADLGAAWTQLLKSDERTSFQRANPSDARPRNVVLVVADGLGINSLTATGYWKGDLATLKLPVRGVSATHGIDALVNDSAATATALSTGERTRRRSIGMVVRDGELVAAPSVLDRAESRGYKTGIVSTTQLTHATPAAFFANVPHRKQTAAIAEDFISFASRNDSDGVDVVIAGGRADFSAEQIEALRSQGLDVQTEWDPESSGPRPFKLLADQGLPSASERKADPDQPSLSQMVELALEKLDGPTPFFLLVEAGQIDWKMHDAVVDSSLLEELGEFDDTVETLRGFVDRRSDTLLVVTSDHDHTLSALDNHYPFASGSCAVATQCGGDFDPVILPVASTVPNSDGFQDVDLQGDYRDLGFFVQYAWPVHAAREHIEIKAPHSAHFVPVFAHGPWATRLWGFVDQPDIGKLLLEWAGD